jgi:DNA-binding PadR family transcriptional regulator
MAGRTRALSTSTLGFALLGLLARGDRSGYDLTQGLKDPVGYFWFAGHSQIYPELSRLEAAGLVAHMVVEQSDRPDKKLYRLTEQGTEALSAWLAAETEVPRKRDELVLKAYSIWRSDPATAVRMMRHHAQIHAEHRSEFEARLARIQVEAGASFWDPGSRWFSVHAVLQRGIGYEREYQEWCEWVVRCLEHPEGEPVGIHDRR